MGLSRLASHDKETLEKLPSSFKRQVQTPRQSLIGADKRQQVKGKVIGALLLWGVTSGCTPAVRAAGHTITPEEPQKTGSGKQEVPAPREAPEPRSVAPSPQPKTPPPHPPETREDLYAELPQDGQLIGEAKPIAIEGLSRGGHWVAHCHVSSGSRFDARLRPKSAPDVFLTIGAKTEPISALLASDTSGRYVVALIDNAAWLIDTAENRRVDLSPLDPDLRFDGLSDHRSFAFANHGLSILKRDNTRGVYVSLDSEKTWSAPLSDVARSIDWGKRPVWRVFGGSQSAHAVTVPEGSTQKSWPAKERKTPALRCLAPTSAYDSFARITAYRPDQFLSTSWVLLGAQKGPLVASEAPGFVTPYKDGWLRREDSGRLLRVRKGTQKQIASARCGARILGADFKSDLFLIACEQYTPKIFTKSKRKSKPKYRFDLYLIKPGFVRGLKADVMRTGIDFLGSEERELYPVRPGAQAALVDFKARKLISLGGDVHVLSTTSQSALLRRGNKLSLWKAGKETALDSKITSLDQQLSRGPTVTIGSQLFLLGKELEQRQLPAPPLAITEQGYSLIPKQAPTLSGWPMGPLLLMGPPGIEEDQTPAEPDEAADPAPPAPEGS